MISSDEFYRLPKLTYADEEQRSAGSALSIEPSDAHGSSQIPSVPFDTSALYVH